MGDIHIKAETKPFAWITNSPSKDAKRQHRAVTKPNRIL